MIAPMSAVPQHPGDGVCNGEVFPRLLPAPRRCSDDQQAVFAAVDPGIAASDHAAFAAKVKPRP